MKLRRIELFGFKSFVDRTVIALDSQVTAVVGPNGCGKSNILDAIRWAMGEQSARSLRGKAMDEVIFAGSENRGPASVAEATLTFDNSEGRCHPNYRDYSEIAVTRRLARDGSSEYVINGAVCRLRDVTELLLAAGVSPRSSMVEQGRMGMIVTARPEERRLLIEEAAGIAKYRIHRRATQRRIDQTKQNLLRISDVVAEMKRSLGSLKRQVSKARRFKQLRDELTELELRAASHQYLELCAVGRRRRSMLTQAEMELERAEVELERHEAAIAGRRQAQREAEERLEALQSESYRCTNEVQQTERTIEKLAGQLRAEVRVEAEGAIRVEGLGRRLQDSEAELAEAEAARATTRERVEGFEQQLSQRQRTMEELKRGRVEEERKLESARQRLTRASAAAAAGERSLESSLARQREGRERAEELRERAVEAERRRVELEAQVAAKSQQLDSTRQRTGDLGVRRKEREGARDRIRAELREAESSMSSVGQELTRCRSRLHSLEEIAGRYENFGQGVRQLMGKPEVRQRTRAVVADLLEVPAELERALAAALGERLQDLVVDDLDSAAAVAAQITADSVGRAAAMPMRPRQEPRSIRAPEADGVVGVLADLVGFEERWAPLARALLGQVVVVEELALAVELSGTLEAVLVTLEGEVVSPTGRIAAGQEKVGLALLQTKREIRRLKQTAKKLEEDHRSRAEVVDAHRADLAQVTAAIDTLRQDAHQGELEVVDQQKDLTRAQDELRRQEGEIRRVEAEVSKLEATVERCDEDRGCIEREIASAVAEREAAEGEQAEAQRALEQRRGAEEGALGEVTEVRVQAASARERLEALRSTIKRLTEECRDLDRRLHRIRDDRVRAAGAQGRIGGELFAARERLDHLRLQAEIARDALTAERERLDRLRSELAEGEVIVREGRQSRDEIRGRAESLRLALHESVTEMRSLTERLEEARGVDLELVLIDYHCQAPVSEEDHQRIDELRRAIDRIGPVSLTAVDEYEELKARFDESNAQKEDLEQSLENLQKAIKKLNREGRRRFRECFDEVNEHFQEVFPRLFEGGRAKLMLTDESDLLETGVDIVAQPPGKRLGRMELMSGGEKAMTAVSLIFALFKASPSPFAILDEVDAPFDDANVRRYLEVLREMAETSQFVLVTHSKLSMTASDILYGVTMEEPGVSKMVSVRLQGEEQQDRTAAAA